MPNDDSIDETLKGIIEHNELEQIEDAVRAISLEEISRGLLEMQEAITNIVAYLQSHLESLESEDEDESPDFYMVEEVALLRQLFALSSEFVELITQGYEEDEEE